MYCRRTEGIVATDMAGSPVHLTKPVLLLAELYRRLDPVFCRVMWSSLDFGNFSGTADASGGFFRGSSTTSAKKALQNRGVMPCTCAEIISATQDGDKFVSSTGVQFSQVTLVGLIRSVNESATRIDYEIDDYTGPSVLVKQFVDDDDSPADSGSGRKLREFTYVRVYGHVRSFQGDINVVAFKVFPVTDFNEITCHIMETIYARMLHAKAASSQTKGDVTTKDSAVNMVTNIRGLTALQSQVLSCVRAALDDNGVTVSQICEKLRGVPEKQIRDDLDFLSAEGHVYSTVDDNHFRVTER
uniref:Replication protein A 32 kDa subunit n=1 Tax=Echinococcus granulosus TaxID=6210 RepID=A0A068WE05_ECHGR|nr:replication protein A 32 kDa subunit [Echinococcus granulosus]